MTKSDALMRPKVVHLAREVGHGTGVGSVVKSLAGALGDLGFENEFWTLADAGLRHRHARNGIVSSKIQLLVDVIFYSTVGTLRAIKRWRNADDVVVLSHNDCLYGDVFVNHGLIAAALAERGRLPRNPLHWFLLPRERYKYGRLRRRHLVVCLNREDEERLRALYPHSRARTTVIPNGIDLDRFQLPGENARTTSRQDEGYAAADTVLLFVGHEYERKGLWSVINALEDLPDSYKLLVVGGVPRAISDARSKVHSRGLAHRVRFAGQSSDPRRHYALADIFVLPTQYETAPLVLLEALAMGVPCVMTSTGLGPRLLRSGETGEVTSREPCEVAQSVLMVKTLLDSKGRDAVANLCRSAAEPFAWETVAKQYASEIASVYDLRRKRR